MLNTISVAFIGLNAALVAGTVFGSRPLMFVAYGLTVGAFALGLRIRGRYAVASGSGR